MASLSFQKSEVVISQPWIEIYNWSKFGMQIACYLQKRETSPNQKPEVDFRLYGRHLRKLIWRHNSIDDHRIFTKIWFVNEKSQADDGEKVSIETEVEFQHGNRLFSEIESSNIWAVDWDIWSKFDMQIVFTF